MSNENAVARPPIRWGRILLSAVLTVVVALALVVGAVLVLSQNPGGVLDRLCPPVSCPGPESTGNIIADFTTVVGYGIGCGIARGLACTIVILLLGLVTAIGLAVIFSVIFVRLIVRQRLLIHWVLTVILSILIALGLVFLLSVIV